MYTVYLLLLIVDVYYRKMNEYSVVCCVTAVQLAVIIIPCRCLKRTMKKKRTENEEKRKLVTLKQGAN